MPADHHQPTVRVYVPSLDTANATELCIRSMRHYADYPFEVTVGESGSTDTSLAMLEEFKRRGWLTLEVAAGRMHHEWKDHWLRTCPENFALFLHSDVEFRGPWLNKLVEVATAETAALVCGEMVPEAAHYVEPLRGRVIRLAERPPCWYTLLDVSQTATLPASFEFHAEESGEVPEGVIGYDTGGWFFQMLKDHGLRWTVMPRGYRRNYHHYSGLWGVPIIGRRGRKKLRDLKTVDRRLRRYRALQDGGRVTLWMNARDRLDNVPVRGLARRVLTPSR
jgi:Glycosyl transferase family 2